jgi:hypothetical protein
MDHKTPDSPPRLIGWTWRGRKAGVRTTIMLGFVAVLAISGAALVGIWTEARLLRASYDSLRDDALPAISRLEDLKTVSHAYMQSVIAHAYAALWAERFATERSAKDAEAARREVRIRGGRLRDSAAAVARLGNMGRMGIKGDPREEILSSVELFESQGQKIVDLASAGRHEDVPALAEKMRFGHGYLAKVVEGVIQQKRIDIAGIDDSVRTAIDRVLLMLAIAGAVAIPLTLLVGWYIANRIARRSGSCATRPSTWLTGASMWRCRRRPGTRSATSRARSARWRDGCSNRWTRWRARSGSPASARWPAR